MIIDNTGEELIKTQLDVKNLSYTYTDGYCKIFEDLTFRVKNGEFLALVGPSGCGKTTLLHILAGLITTFKGHIFLDGQEESRLGKISLMPQDDLLLPWRTVLENGALPLEIKGINKRDAQEQVKSLLDQFGLSDFENAYPYQLSGGMRQRVAFLRSILSGSQIILLDEPFSALDSLNRMKMQEWLLDMWQKFTPTIIFITHDVEEAVFLAERVFLLSKPPVKNIQEYQIPFPYPRTRTFLGQKDFVRLRQEILSGLLGG